MSTTISTAKMVEQIQARVPLGLSSQFCLDRLNEAYRWLIQRGPMVWQLKSANVTISGTGTFTLPTDCDNGKLMVLSGGAAWQMEIPYKPWSDMLKYQYDDQTRGVTGMYSCWSFQSTTGYLFPVVAAKASEALALIYHAKPGTPLTSGASTYFPTPDAFDTLLIDLAVARTESPSWYRFSGWDVIQKDAQDQALALIEQHRSSRNSLLGLVEQAKQTHEAQAMKGE